MTSATSDARPNEQHRVLTDLMRPRVGVASAASDRVTPELELMAPPDHLPLVADRLHEILITGGTFDPVYHHILAAPRRHPDVRPARKPAPCPMSSRYLERDDSGGASVSADVLARIRSPRDLRGLSRDELTKLAAAIRAFLIEKVSVTGGHLGPNLGVVELTIALHRVFDSPRDALIFDTGHQAYPHKFLTGRQDDFDHLRASGGLSGYPSRAESEHDWVESSHASAALSYADGLAKAFELAGRQIAASSRSLVTAR